jgi:asparagine synthase (glutamine-hydrolysing)
MCGICGMIDLKKHHRGDPALVRRMADRIAHRGPDGDGFHDAPDVTLGMRRLSIIDVDGSDQPLYNEDRSIAMVFNGEIYNYRELRADLLARGHALRTEGDGETIIHLYEESGLDLFRHLRGMYAFALWDSHAERLLLAVDHIGMKPLYLHERDGKLLFASEVKALFADEATPRGLNLEVLDTYLSFGYMIGAETLFDGVRRLPPGHALVAENGTTRLHPFWEFPKPTLPSPQTPLPHGEGLQKSASPLYEMERVASDSSERGGEDNIIAQARARLTESVHLHLRSDVPLGLFLSGGVDSASVLALMAREAGGRIKTFTVGYDAKSPDNELLRARQIAEHFQTDHYERVITAADWWRGFEKAVYHHDEPIANSSAVSLLLLAEETGRQVKVVLTGLGGDELFAGYSGHSAIPQLLRRQQTWGKLLSPVGGALAALEPHYPAMKRYRVIGALPTYLPRVRQAALPREEALLRMQSFDGMVFSDSLRDRLYSPELKAAWSRARHKERTYAAIVERSWRDDAYNTAQALTINTWLTGNALLHTDKVTMAASLEARVPFFDPNLLQFAADVPPALRMRGNKYVLREAMRPYVPAFALERPKQPFGTPILNWFDDELQTRIQDVLLNPDAFIGAYFNRPELEKLLRDHFARRAQQVEVMFRLLTLELWGQTFVRQGAPVNAHA